MMMAETRFAAKIATEAISRKCIAENLSAALTV